MGLNGHKNPDIIVAEIMMTRTTSNGAILLVEGESDHRFFLTQTVAECQIIDTEGKPNLQASITISNSSGISGVLGVADDDADSLLGVNPIDNVVLTDTRDMEGLLIRSDALHFLLAQYGSLTVAKQLEQEGTTPHTILVDACLPHGRLRILARQLNKEVDFKRLRITNYLRADTTLDFDRLMHDAASQFELSAEDITNQSALLPDTWDVWRVVQGHDLVATTCHALQNGRLGSKNPGRRIIEAVLSASMPTEQWLESETCARIVAWEETNGLRLLRD